MIRKSPQGWILKSKRSGRILGHHRTRKSAIKQEQAIYFSKQRRRRRRKRR